MNDIVNICLESDGPRQYFVCMEPGNHPVWSTDEDRAARYLVNDQMGDYDLLSELQQNLEEHCGVETYCVTARD